MAHGYEVGRLNISFAGHCDFAKYAAASGWKNPQADTVIRGAQLLLNFEGAD